MWPRSLLLLLGIKALLAALFLLSGILPLSPDEAQYWLWSRAIDWGYYSKPPGVAWQIFFGTTLFGHTEFGVRFAALLIGFALPLFVWRLALRANLSGKAALYSAVAMALCPLGVLSSLLSTTDGGFILFWTAAATAAAREKPRFWVVGLLIGLSALFKWPAYLLWIPLGLLFPWRALLPGLTLSLIGLLPSVIWNAQHDWATFMHVGSTMAGRASEQVAAPLFNGNAIDFAAAQIGLISPVFFFFLLYGLWRLSQTGREQPRALLLAGLITGLFLTIYLALSFKQKMQGNWVAFAYPTGMLLIGREAERRPRLFQAGSALSILLSLGLLFLPYLQRNETSLAGFKPPYKFNLFRHNLGWDRLEALLEQNGYDPEKHFLFSDTYQNSCVLSFYSEEQQRAYFLNLDGRRKNQFSYWPTIEEEVIGQDGYFLLTEHEPDWSRERNALLQTTKEQLAPYFDSITLVGEAPLFVSYGEPAKQAALLLCRGYNGKKLDDPERY